jgi:zinc metalloprotease ZmpB
MSGSIVRAGEILTISYAGSDELILNGFEPTDDADQYKVVAPRNAPPSISFETATTPDPVNKDALNAAITEADGLVKTDYTPNSWSALQSVLSAAQAVAGNDDATADAVGEATMALTEAITALVPRADKTALSMAITAAGTKVESNYTPNSWSDLETALTTAQTVAGNNNAIQEQVTNATSALESAKNALVLRADKTALNTAIAGTAELVETDYTAESWQVLVTALDAAQSVLTN